MAGRCVEQSRPALPYRSEIDMKWTFPVSRALRALVLLLPCTLAQAQYSITTRANDVPLVREFKKLQLVVIEREFRPPGLANASERDKDLVNAKYYDFVPLVQQRAPLLLAANGLQARVMLVTEPDAASELSADGEADEGVLVIDAASYKKFQKVLFGPTFLTVNFNVTIMGRKAEEAGKLERLWGFGQGVYSGPDDVWGALKMHRIDESHVDSMLQGLLNTLGEKGFVSLPDGKAIKPKPSS
jgi:hypothetical protein